MKLHKLQKAKADIKNTECLISYSSKILGQAFKRSKSKRWQGRCRVNSYMWREKLLKLLGVQSNE